MRTIVVFTVGFVSALVGFATLHWTASDCEPPNVHAEHAMAKKFQITFNANDYQQSLFDFKRRRFGISKQVDRDYRHYPGDVHFNGRELTIIETDAFTGTLLDLGNDAVPDSEFSLFYGLRLYKRRFQIRQFPYQDRFEPLESVDRNRFFFGRHEENLSVRPQVGHTIALRCFHRTQPQQERILLLRVIEVTNSGKLTIIWRELKDRKELHGGK